MWNGTMFGDLDWPLNASRGLSAIDEFLVYIPKLIKKHIFAENRITRTQMDHVWLVLAYIGQIPINQSN